MEVNYNYSEFTKVISNGKKITYGNNPSVIYYNDLLVSINEELYKLAKNDRLRNEEHFNILASSFNNIDINQLNILLEKQPNIKLSKFPKGIFKINNNPVGLILPDLRGYRWLHYLEDETRHDLANIARGVLESLHELEENGIYRLNINHSNILYNGIKPELIDLYGKKIIFDNPNLEGYVYNDYIRFLYQLVHQGQEVSLIHEFSDLLNSSIDSYDECNQVVKRLEKIK